MTKGEGSNPLFLFALLERAESPTFNLYGIEGIDTTQSHVNAL